MNVSTGSSPLPPNPHSASPQSRNWLRTILIVLAVLGLLALATFFGLILPAFRAMQARAAHTVASTQVRQVMLACLHYDSQRRQLPTDIVDAQGKPLLSWRVQILPYMDEAELYKKFRLDEPWDSEHNRQLLAEMPNVFRCAGHELGTNTVCLRPKMAGAILDPAKPTISTNDISRGDGVANTILLLEADADQAVEWTRPGDFDVPTSGAISGLGKLRNIGIVVSFADGSTRSLSDSIDANTLRALITYNGGEPIDRDAIE